MTWTSPPAGRLDDLPMIAESLADSVARRLASRPALAPGALAYLARHTGRATCANCPTCSSGRS
jgi:hypothetical protein